jgi:hypothetical protein
MAQQPASPEHGTQRHKHWDKVVSAAYLRIIGHTQAEAAEAVGRNARTIREWEADTALWNAARDEARDRWLREVTDAARRSVLKAAGRNADLGLKVLERVDPAFAPKQKLEHTGKDGGPVETASRVVFYIPSNGRDGNA